LNYPQSWPLTLFSAPGSVNSGFAWHVYWKNMRDIEDSLHTLIDQGSRVGVNYFILIPHFLQIRVKLDQAALCAQSNNLLFDFLF
jgi:hypothetical protein